MKSQTQPSTLLALDLGTKSNNAHTADIDNVITKQLPGQQVMQFPPDIGRPVTTGDLVYLAGFFDGEGCVQLRKRGSRWECQLRFINTSYPLMKWVSDITGGSLSTRKAYGKNSRRSFEVCLQYRRAERWSRLMRPYLRLKADEVDLLLEFRRTIRLGTWKIVPPEVASYRMELIRCCSILKKRAY